MKRTYTTYSKSNYTQTYSKDDGNTRTTVFESPGKDYRRETNFPDGSKLITETTPGNFGKSTVTYINPNTGNHTTSVHKKSPLRVDETITTSHFGNDRITTVRESSPVRTIVTESFNPIEDTLTTTSYGNGYSRTVRESSPVRRTITESYRPVEETYITEAQQELGNRTVYTTVTRSPSRRSPFKTTNVYRTERVEPLGETMVERTIYEPLRETVVERTIYEPLRETVVKRTTYSPTRTYVTRSPARHVLAQTTSTYSPTRTYVTRSPTRIITSTFK